jgi:hypothetical protein
MKQHFYAGSMGPYIYDDEDTYTSDATPFQGENRMAFASTGQGKILEAPTEDEHVVRLKDMTGTFLENRTPPTSISKFVGGTATGTVAGVQEWNDGSEFSVAETTGTPGFDIRFTFSNITDIKRISSNILYEGNSTHHVELQIYRVSDATWKTIVQIPTGFGYNYRFVDFPPDPADYIDTLKQVVLRVYHVNAGNASHDIHIDYIALIV